MQSLTHTTKGVPYYWNELKDLSSDEKLEIIMLLSSSMREPKNSSSSKEYTKEMLDRFSGAWVGEESAEDIIDNINKSRNSHSQPVSFE